MKVDLQKALTYTFKDEKWIIKMLIGGLLLFVPIANFFVIGYLMRILKQSSEGKEPALPEWTDWENLFKEGAFGFLIMLVYGVVIGIGFILLSFLSLIPVLGCLFSLIQLILMFAIGFLFLPWVLLCLIKYMQTGNFGDAFDFQGNFERIKNNIADYSIVALLTGVINSVCSMLCCLIIPSFYGSVVTFQALGSLYYITEHPESVPQPEQPKETPQPEQPKEEEPKQD